MLIRELVREQACSGVLCVVPYLKWAEQHILLKGGWVVENFVRLLRILRNRAHVRCGGERDCNAVLKFGIRATAHKNSQRGSGFQFSSFYFVLLCYCLRSLTSAGEISKSKSRASIPTILALGYALSLQTPRCTTIPFVRQKWGARSNNSTTHDSETRLSSTF